MATKSDAPVVMWFREDLRLSDQPALAAALALKAPLICLYILDEESPGLRPFGGASRWWLHHSLDALSKNIEALGGRLDILRGPARKVLRDVVHATEAQAVMWTRRYDAAAIELDKQIKADLTADEVRPESFNGQLLHEPWTIKNKAGEFFRVFTPYWKTCLAKGGPEAPLAAPRKLSQTDWPSKGPKRLKLKELKLLPTKPDWAGGLRDNWQPGETGAKALLKTFLDEGLSHYAAERDRPDRPATSRLSPHLRFGEISPRQVVTAARHAGDAEKASGKDVEKFVSEIGWREFAHHLLFHFPKLRSENFQPRFDNFPWRKAKPSELKAWQMGMTGYPIVDAGMRELWITGTMHNRVRMIVASFLVKDLMIDWREGEEWFWDTLCDACPANNTASWQWVAGSGADAAPYFRVFNPILQGEKFDPEGDYVRKFVPELTKLPNAWIHRPWEAPSPVLKAAGIGLPKDYPLPMVDHSKARDRALAAFSSIKSAL